MKTRTLIDAVAAYVAGLGLPTYTLYKYHTPPGLLGPTTFTVPALAVTAVVDKADLEDTGGVGLPPGYKWNDHIRLTWYGAVLTPQMPTVVNQAAAAAHLDQVEMLVNDFAGLLAVPGFAPEHSVTVGNTVTGHVEGGPILGSEINLTVSYWEV